MVYGVPFKNDNFGVIIAIGSLKSSGERAILTQKRGKEMLRKGLLAVFLVPCPLASWTKELSP